MAGGVFVAPAAMAAETAAAQAESVPAPLPEREEASPRGGDIVVTGSRIQQVGLTSPTPVTALSIDDLSNAAPGNMVESIAQVPSFFNTNVDRVSSNSGVSDVGGSALNLRGLGRNRTLVLLNSRRIAPNNREGTVNIDILPSALVKRVEVVTGGASASYGTDAVAGVVNFILDTDFTGLKGHIQAGISRYGDDENGEFELTWGAPIGERGHFIVSGEAFKAKGIRNSSRREWQKQGWGIMTNPAYAIGNGQPRQIIARRTVRTNITCGGMMLAPGSSLDRFEFKNDGTAAPFVYSQKSTGLPGGLETQSLDTFSGGGSGCRPTEQLGDQNVPVMSADQDIARIFAYADYDVTDNIKLYSQFLYAHNELGFGASSTIFNSPWQATLYRGNAYLDDIMVQTPGGPRSINQVLTAENVASFTFNRYNQELYPESDTRSRNRTMAAAIGVSGDIATGSFLDTWKFDAFYQYSKNNQRNAFLSKMNQYNIRFAMDAVRDPASGAIVCRVALLNPSQFGDCQPINLFGQGHLSQSQIDYITTPGDMAHAIIQYSRLVEHDVEFALSGPVWEGWGAGTISAAVGASYRKQSLASDETGPNVGFPGYFNTTTVGVRGLPSTINADPEIQLFDSAAPLNGGFDVKEAFAELNVPILADMPLVQSLTASLAARWADYQGSGTIWAYKAGLDWQVTDGLRLRGTYSRDVRAPTLSERFDSQRTNGSINNDPVTGLSYNFSQITGGNPNVKPERADTITAGAVFQPDFLPGFNMTIDYWKLKVADAIGRLSTQRIVEDCNAGATELCGFIDRDPVTQQIFTLRNLYINLNEENGSGIDVELNYRKSLNLFGGGPENVHLRFLGTWLKERSITVPGAPKRNDVGNLKAPDPDAAGFPEFQATAQLTYENGPLTIGLQERYLHKGYLNTLWIEGVDIDDNRVPAVWYTNLNISYQLMNDSDDSVELFLHVSNLFDKAPPRVTDVIGGTGGEAMQTNNFLYDVIGRRYVTGVRFKF
jgi:outer membrane receptor protein involved in Fe transport